MLSFFPTLEPLGAIDWLPPAPAQPRSARWRRAEQVCFRRALLTSGVVHLFGMLAGIVVALWLLPLPGLVASRQIELAATLRQPAPQPPLLLLATSPTDPSAAALAEAEFARLSAAAIPPELRADILDGNRPLDASAAASEWVLAQMRDEIARAERLSQGEQLARLQSLTGQLNRIASEDSVDAVTGRLAGLLGTEDRAQQPAAQPVAGEFDFGTAQVHDVKRSEPQPGQFEYVAILLDAQGRTMETPLSPAEGEQLYQVMELVKANPLLGRIYRGLVMSLLDKVMKPAAGPTLPAADE
jgi:hypothetical protein